MGLRRPLRGAYFVRLRLTGPGGAKLPLWSMAACDWLARQLRWLPIAGSAAISIHPLVRLSSSASEGRCHSASPDLRGPFMGLDRPSAESIGTSSRYAFEQLALSARYYGPKATQVQRSWTWGLMGLRRRDKPKACRLPSAGPIRVPGSHGVGLRPTPQSDGVRLGRIRTYGRTSPHSGAPFGGSLVRRRTPSATSYTR